MPLSCVGALGVRCSRIIRRLRHEAGHRRGTLPQRLLVVRVEVVQTRECTFAIAAAVAWQECYAGPAHHRRLGHLTSSLADRALAAYILKKWYVFSETGVHGLKIR